MGYQWAMLITTLLLTLVSPFRMEPPTEDLTPDPTAGTTTEDYAEPRDPYLPAWAGEEISLDDQSTWEGLTVAQKDELRRAAARKRAESPHGAAPGTQAAPAPAPARRPTSSPAYDRGSYVTALQSWERRRIGLIGVTAGTWAVHGIGVIGAIAAPFAINNPDDPSREIQATIAFGIVGYVGLVSSIISTSALAAHLATKPKKRDFAFTGNGVTVRF